MMQRVFVTFFALTLLLGGIAASVKASEADDQRNLMQSFIVAYFTKDMPTVRMCVPKNQANLFTQYPFSATPTLSNAKVHINQALVEFSGPVIDQQMIGKGGILFSKHGKLWQVRQLMFYNKVPRIFNMPSRSITSEDRSYEGTVNALAKKFMVQWKSNCPSGMLGLWYNWVKDNPDRITGLQMKNFQASSARTQWNEPFMNYSVNLSYKLGPLSYRMTAHGGMVLVKERGAWKVRANSFFLYF